jgi:uncharacterized protein YbjT (DUF2867 family)
MQYFVTGATGFMGERLVKKLLQPKGAVVHFFIRPASLAKVDGLREFWGLKEAKKCGARPAGAGGPDRAKAGTVC